MSRSHGNRLPAGLLALLDGERIAEKTGLALLLATADARGAPHPALLSVGEVLARDAGTLRLALYATSTTTRNLREQGPLLLALAHDDSAWYIKATAREHPAPPAALPGLAVFDATIDEVLEDGEAIARVTSGFTIELTRGSEQTVASWERVLAALRALP